MDTNPDAYKRRAIAAVGELYSLLVDTPLPGHERAHLIRVANAQHQANHKLAAWKVSVRLAPSTTTP